jgi:DUF4097 and DUF4098 domain-containing protein YvlB
LKGEIHFSSGDGSIEADSIDGVFEAKTGDGHIRVSGRWDRLDLQTQDGSVEADARAGSKMSGSWRVSTGDGHVTLRLPENFAADLDAHTGDGKITVDFPVTMSGSNGSDVVGQTKDQLTAEARRRRENRERVIGRATLERHLPRLWTRCGDSC